LLKMFQRQLSAGSTPEFWDTAWDATASDLSSEDAFCEENALHALFSDKLRPDRLFLEGGCGPGHWLRYFHRRGYRVVGLDFAPRAVERLQRALPGADVRLGDIERLPFADGEIHAYYSGGVVEHDESGPEVALREARRVLADDGWFLCSVPDTSPLRNILYRKDRTLRRDMAEEMVVTRVAQTRPESPPEGMHFFQYVFSPDEFSGRLSDAGFEVTAHFGYALAWGMMEIPGMTALSRRLLERRSAGSSAPPPSTAAVASPGEATPRHRRVGTRILRRALLQHMSNMRMYVARPRGKRS
jgi:SAM-dependent methyltransferase